MTTASLLMHESGCGAEATEVGGEIYWDSEAYTNEDWLRWHDGPVSVANSG
jgi:hypothetical protein